MWACYTVHQRDLQAHPQPGHPVEFGISDAHCAVANVGLRRPLDLMVEEVIPSGPSSAGSAATPDRTPPAWDATLFTMPVDSVDDAGKHGER